MSDTISTPIPAVQAAAAHVAAAENHLQAAQAALDAAQAEAEPLHVRLADVAHRRTEIAARRAAGELRETDGADLEVLSLDGAELQKLRAAADERIQPLLVARDRAAGALAAERDALRRTEDLATFAALAGHAERLAGLLGRTIAALTEIEARTGTTGRPAWLSREFYEAIRKQASRANLL